jgi:hypothetical protein
MLAWPQAAMPDETTQNKRAVNKRVVRFMGEGFSLMISKVTDS